MQSIIIVFLILTKLYCIYIDASIFKAVSNVGDYTLVTIFNNETITEDKLLFVNYQIATKTLNFLNVKEQSKTDHVICRISSQQRIVTGPNGCDNPKNPSEAIQSANCISDEINVELKRRIFYTTWYLSKNDDLCYIRGGNGDVRLCAGPLRLAIENENAFRPRKVITALDLLTSQYQFLDSLAGPLAMSPSITRIQMVLPSLIANTSCVDPDGSVTFNGTYSNVNTDPNPEIITVIWKAFQKNDSMFRRLYLKRDSPDSVNFRIVLGNTFASNQLYNDVFQSPVINSSLYTSETLFLNWMETINYGYNYTMTNPTTNGTCWLVLDYEREVNYNIIPPYPVTAANYSENQEPRVYYVTAVCSVAFGRLDANGNLAYPYCPEGDVCGGRVRYVTPGNINYPIGVPPNPGLHYRFDCVEMYPKSNSFFNFNDVITPRISLAQQICCSSFLSDSLIRSNVKPNEKFIQCNKLGGYTFGRSQSHCCRPITFLKCQLGWYYYDQRCFYMFDPEIEGRYSSPLDQGDNICSQFNSFSQPLVEINFYDDLWLLNYFIYFKRNPDIGAAFRVPVLGQPYCQCYFTYIFESRQCPCYDIEIIIDDKKYQVFPICFYSISTRELEPLYSDIQVSIETANTWRFGQVGPPPNGLEALCDCYPGSTGKNCETFTCILEDVIINSNVNNSKIEFFRKCYENKKGSCYNGQPLTCKCNDFYGPSASLDPVFESLYQFRDMPCGCPASIQTKGNFVINDKVYQDQNVLYLPCSGSFNGQCIVPNNTNSGYCSCTSAVDLVFGDLVDVFDGRGCGCPKPNQSWKAITKNGVISTSFCNHKGICCPFGETYQNPYGDIDNIRCFDEVTDDPLEGCQCDNGWGGFVCVCPKPFNYLENARFESFNNGLYYFKTVNVDVIAFYVSLRACLKQNPSNPIRVYLSNEVGKSDKTIECTFNVKLALYVCNSVLSYKFVVFQNIDIESPCVTGLFKENYSLCGRNETINNFAGVFNAIPAYQSPNINIRNPKVGISNFGCGYSECMCNSLYGGKECSFGVSSLRYIPSNNDLLLTKFYCGESIAVPNLINPVEGRGYLNYDMKNCTCNPITNVNLMGSSSGVDQYFTGKACECAYIKNNDRDQILKCAGHGDCISSWFPMGVCEIDKEKFELDALYTPYSVKRNNIEPQIKGVAKVNSYFFYQPEITPGTSFPTNNPTMSPTPFPTFNPTTAPTTSSPTTRNPTNVPTTSTPTTANPTSAPTVVVRKLIFYDSNRFDKGNIGSVATTNSYCTSRATALGLSSLSRASFLRYSTRLITDLPTLMGFSTTSEIYGFKNGVYTYLGTWDTVVNPNGALAATLQSSVFLYGSSIQFWTGSSASNNCNDWTTTAFSGTNGVTSYSSSNWLNRGTLACSISTPWMCLLTQEIPPTLSPTSMSPTTTPTTRNPSETPTATPTESPSRTPTLTPTSQPTKPLYFNRALQYMYEIPTGAEVMLFGSNYNISVSHVSSPPLKLKINTLTNSLRSVLWKDVVYRYWDYQLGTTDTYTLPLCNPAMPSWIPGETQLLSDGLYSCPTIDECILTTDCTDDLTPSVNTPPFSGFPDLRACLCEYEVVQNSIQAPLSPLTEYQIYLFEGNLTSEDPPDIIPDLLGSIDCSSFIDRTIDCMYSYLNPDYVLRCSAQPIGCYDQSIGRFFGAFNSQNPNFVYPANQSEWTYQHYWGVASLMNYKMFRKNGEYADPFTFDLWNQYTWINGSTSNEIVQSEYTMFMSKSFTYLLQQDAYVYLDNNIPPPVIQNTWSDEWDVLYEECVASTSLSLGDIFNSCKVSKWSDDAYIYSMLKQAGSYGYIKLPGNVILFSFQFSWFNSVPGEKITTGVEIYNQYNEKCGGYYNELGISDGENFTISCTFLPSTFNVTTSEKFFIVKAYGAQTTYDVPGLFLNNEYFSSVYDPLAEFLDLTLFDLFEGVIPTFLTSCIDTEPFCFGSFIEDAKWPKRTRIPPLSPPSVYVTVNTSIELPPGEAVFSWGNISVLILENNTYPYNLALESVYDLYDVSDVNFTNQYDLNQLFYIYTTWLAARHCGAEDVDCRNSGLGDCIVHTDFNLPYLNIDTPLNYEFIGVEGGCNCFHTFSKGYYNTLLFCNECQNGYGPYTIDDMASIIYYNNVVNPTYTNGMLPVSALNFNVDKFESYYSCRYPVGQDPVPASASPVNICSGHGVASGYNTTKKVDIEVWNGKYIVSCQKLVSNEINFEYFNQTTSLNSLIYTSQSGDIFNIIGTYSTYVMYYISQSNMYDCYQTFTEDLSFPKPFRMNIECTGSDHQFELEITCVNDILFTRNETSIVNNLLYLKNPFILQSW